MTCAAYRGKFGEWPSQVRLFPLAAYEIAQVLTPEDFEKLAIAMEIRITLDQDITAGGRGVIHYGEHDESLYDEELLRTTEKWLGVTPRH